MTTRQGFHLSLETLRKAVLEMGRITQNALRQSVDSLLLMDSNVANQIVAGDQKINQLQFSIEEECVLLLARQQPVARDLRRIMAALHISIDLERIADMAVDIAKTTLRISHDVPDVFRQDMVSMFTTVDTMITVALDAYGLESTEKAETLAERDDRMDHSYKITLEHLATLDSSSDPERLYSYAILARCMERIGDHVTNIGESVIYIQTGNRAELNA